MLDCRLEIFVRSFSKIQRDEKVRREDVNVELKFLHLIRKERRTNLLAIISRLREQVFFRVTPLRPIVTTGEICRRFIPDLHDIDYVIGKVKFTPDRCYCTNLPSTNAKTCHGNLATCESKVPSRPYFLVPLNLLEQNLEFVRLVLRNFV